MTLKLYKIGLISLLTVLMHMPAYAVLPVIDIDGLVAMVHQLKSLHEQYQELQALKDRAEQQINRTEHLISNTSGTRDIEKLLRNLSALHKEQYSPSNWQDALKGLSGGNPARYRQLVRQYEKNNTHMSRDSFEMLTNTAQANEYQKLVDVNRAVSIGASSEYEQINTHMDNITKLSEKISNSDDLKYSQDLTARLQAEVAYTNVMVARQMILLNQQLGENQTLEIRAREHDARLSRISH